jgi:hypothetical protein
MRTLNKPKSSASKRWSATAHAALVSLGFIAVVPFASACGAPPSDDGELAANRAEESLVTSDAEEAVDPGAGYVQLGTLEQALTVHTVDSNWTCASCRSCEDTYDFNIPGGTRVRMNLSNVGT